MTPIQAAAPDVRALLNQSHLTVVSGEPDFGLRDIARAVAHPVRIDGRIELEVLLGELLCEVEHGAEVAPKTLDLIGHTRTRGALLALGDWVIDVASQTTTAFFRGLAEHAVLPRLGIRAVRLLGCNTASTPQGKTTVKKLAELLELEVWGAHQLLCTSHWGPSGFLDQWSGLLAEARQLGDGAQRTTTAAPAFSPYPRVLDVDALPAVALVPTAMQRRIAELAQAQQVLQLVRRKEGAIMPDVLAVPSVELALPATELGAYHIAHVLLDGEFLRFYPDGMTATGIVFPVEDAGALRALVAAMLPDPYRPYSPHRPSVTR
jgi:hypothetical protein